MRCVLTRYQADKLFEEFLATADTSNGPATQEIIDFHMVPDMRKSFSKHVKEYKCTYVAFDFLRVIADSVPYSATPRQLSRAEQDKINPGRKSVRTTRLSRPLQSSHASHLQLMWYMSVTVTPEAQKVYLEKNPAIAEKTKAKREQIKAEAQEKRNKSPDGEVGQPAQPEASASSSKKRTAADAGLPARAVSKAKKATA